MFTSLIYFHFFRAKLFFFFFCHISPAVKLEATWIFLHKGLCWPKFIFVGAFINIQNLSRHACVLYSHNHDTYTRGNIVNTLMTNKHTSLEKYTSHILFEMVAKGLRKGYVLEVSWGLNKLQHIGPQFLWL